MSLPRFVDVTAANAANILGLYPRRARSRPAATPTSCSSTRRSPDADKGRLPRLRLQPLEGWHVTGWPVMTILRGKVIVERGKLLGSTSDGRLLTRKIDGSILRRAAC